VEFKRKKDESFEAFLRRFNKKLQQSGKLYEAKQRKYHSKKKSKRKLKEGALVGKKIRAHWDYLRKTGKVKDDKMR